MADELRDAIRRAVDEHDAELWTMIRRKDDLIGRIERAVAQHLPYEALLLREEKALADSEFKTVSGHLAELEAEVQRLDYVAVDGQHWDIRRAAALARAGFPRIASCWGRPSPKPMHNLPQ